MAPFLIDTFEEIVREKWARFVLDDVIEKANSTTTLIKLNTLDINIKIMWMLVLVWGRKLRH